MELRGAAAIVTGGSRGLGAALGEALAGRGARVVLVARGREALGETVARIRAQGGEAHGLAEDIGDKEANHRISGRERGAGRADRSPRSTTRARSAQSPFACCSIPTAKTSKKYWR